MSRSFSMEVCRWPVCVRIARTWQTWWMYANSAGHWISRAWWSSSSAAHCFQMGEIWSQSLNLKILSKGSLHNAGHLAASSDQQGDKHMFFIPVDPPLMSKNRNGPSGRTNRPPTEMVYKLGQKSATYAKLGPSKSFKGNCPLHFCKVNCSSLSLMYGPWRPDKKKKQPQMSHKANLIVMNTIVIQCVSMIPPMLK